MEPKVQGLDFFSPRDKARFVEGEMTFWGEIGNNLHKFLISNFQEINPETQPPGINLLPPDDITFQGFCNFNVETRNVDINLHVFNNLNVTPKGKVSMALDFMMSLTDGYLNQDEKGVGRSKVKNLGAMRTTYDENGEIVEVSNRTYNNALKAALLIPNLGRIMPPLFLDLLGKVEGIKDRKYNPLNFLRDVNLVLGTLAASSEWLVEPYEMYNSAIRSELFLGKEGEIDKAFKALFEYRHFGSHASKPLRFYDSFSKFIEQGDHDYLGLLVQNIKDTGSNALRLSPKPQ